MSPETDSTRIEPVVIIGAGPIGLAAAAHLAQRGEPFVVLEAEDDAAASVRVWSHIRLFTPWRYNIDEAAATLLEETGWVLPIPADACPTGAELVDGYLDPLARHPRIAPFLHLQHRVRAIARDERGKLED
ncbi:MAG TPA: FAD-dependent oxidoreductase, partial [Thermomicrobiales bacterium]|nr:FAD-dependent oxidoreductase [Thermomicrobiales bacterium]